MAAAATAVRAVDVSVDRDKVAGVVGDLIVAVVDDAVFNVELAEESFVLN